MNSEFRGFGRFLLLVPVVVNIPMRMIVGPWEESHRAAIVALCLAVSGVFTVAIVAALDKKSGIDVYSRHAWTTGIMESQHIFLFLPSESAAQT
jgi:hypothetical protein